MKLTIGYLYPDLMNIYGDTGNIIVLQKRAEWRGIKVKIKKISLKEKVKKGECDIYFFGGGQDQAQGLVAKDLIKKGHFIKQEVERGVPLLAICGGYQLLGEYYKPHNSPKLHGVGLFPAYTVAGSKRMIGNIVIETMFGKLVGFENHSGQTYLKKEGMSLGLVTRGFGNNGQDKSEGCVYKNAIGCYMHGSLLPKNPHLADWLLEKALNIKLPPLDDSLELQAHKEAI